MELRRTDDLLEGGNTVQHFLEGDRVGAFAVDRCRKAFELGGQRVEALILDDFGRRRHMPAGRRPLGSRRKAELELRCRKLDGALRSVNREAIGWRRDKG